MKFLYLVPGPLTATAGGAAELRCRHDLLRTWASPGVTIDAWDTTDADGAGMLEHQQSQWILIMIRANPL